MDENLPEVQPDSQNPLVSEGKRMTVVTADGEIYLPASRLITPRDADFTDIVNEVLPEYAASLSDEALRRPKGYPAWAVLLLLLFFGTIIAGFFFLQPQMHLENTSTDVPPPENDRYRGEFSGELKKANDFAESGRYKDARACLSPVIDKLLEKWEPGSGQKNELVFRTYFDLFDHSEWDAASAKQLNDLIEKDDNYRWKLFNIKRRLEEMGGEEPGRLSGKAGKIDPEFFNGIIRQIEFLRKEQPDLKRQMDLYECLFRLKKWRRMNIPKPNANSGVEEREEVWKKACRYPKDEDFRKIRRYLVKQLISDRGGVFMSRITFNGEKYFWNKDLFKLLEQSNREEIKK